MNPQGEIYIDQLYTYISQSTVEVLLTCPNYLLSINLGTKPVTQTQLNNITALQAKLGQTSALKLPSKPSDLGSLNTIPFSSLTSAKSKRRTPHSRTTRSLSMDRKLTLSPSNETRSTIKLAMKWLLSLGFSPILLSAVQQATDTDGILYKPLYSLTGGFQEACDAWFNGTPGGATTYQWRMKNANGKDWSSLGHSTTVNQVGESIFSLIGANKGGDLELTVKEAPLVFNVWAGYWDVPSVRTIYPTLPPQQTQSALLPNPSPKTFNRLRSQPQNYHQQHQHVDQHFLLHPRRQILYRGGFSSFGFHFGAGGSSTTHRNVSTLVTHSDGSSGVISIPPSPPGLTFLLGALGRAT
ncbi:hypothetical protein BDZ45DRAFT_802911 [Acephala macrosclerotiorum]|nr:hypothetical protein BDZ45DRAFT_802911 [Acephala macrosclerotiorum]